MIRLLSSLYPALAILLISVSLAQGQMIFKLDFDGDGTFENNRKLAVGEKVKIDIYVSNIPEPGLVSFGFSLLYNSSVLQVIPESTDVARNLWPENISEPPEIFWPKSPGLLIFTGLRYKLSGNTLTPLPLISGDNIKLATAVFSRIKDGPTKLVLTERLGKDGQGFPYNPDDFLVQSDTDLNSLISFDSDIGSGILLGTMTSGSGDLVGHSASSDFNGDGDVDGHDLARFANKNCNGPPPTLQEFSEIYALP